MRYSLIPMVLLAGCASMPENNCPISSYAAQWACEKPLYQADAQSWMPKTSRRGAAMLQRGNLLAQQVKTRELSDAAAQQKLLDYADELENQRLQRIQAYGLMQPQTVRIVP